MAVATKEEILEYLDSINLEELLDRMEYYVRLRFYNKSDKVRSGFDYLDFCYTVLIKACDGTRKWDKEKSSFEEFVFGSLKSDLYNFFRKNKKSDNCPMREDDTTSDLESYLIEINEYIDMNKLVSDEYQNELDFETVSKNAIDMLREQGADGTELAVFECWLSGYYKPKEISELIGATTLIVNNATKRLSRKRLKIQDKWISLKK